MPRVWTQFLYQSLKGVYWSKHVKVWLIFWSVSGEFGANHIRTSTVFSLSSVYIFSALSIKRKENMAKRIQRELDAQGGGEEVDPDTIDWLSETYKTKSQVAREQKERAERELTEKTVDNDVRYFIVFGRMYFVT